MGNKERTTVFFEKIKEEMKKAGKNKTVCPECGSENVAHILYGLPVYDKWLDNALKSGKIHLGGCCIDADSAAYHCNKCGADFGIYKDGR